jgi:beta-N-acetylhexosaminidase
MKRKAAIISLAGTKLSKGEIQLIKKEKPWGIILFKRNIVSESQLINLIKKIRTIMRDKFYPILIDEEGGKVSRLSNFLDNKLYSQEYFGNIYEKNKTIGSAIYKTYIDSISKKLKFMGININTVPVLDIRDKSAHNIIGSRSYSKNLKTINELGKICVGIYKKNKIATVIKHIPGHGRAKSDSHFKLPIIKENFKTLKNTDFKCFKNSKSFFAMTGHILYSKIDKQNNVTHSPKIISNVIRKLIGFKGILISDDISMKALKYDIVQNAEIALSAGCNLVLYCWGKLSEMKKLLARMPNIDSFTSKKTSEFYKFLS